MGGGGIFLFIQIYFQLDSIQLLSPASALLLAPPFTPTLKFLQTFQRLIKQGSPKTCRKIYFHFLTQSAFLILFIRFSPLISSLLLLMSKHNHIILYKFCNYKLLKTCTWCIKHFNLHASNGKKKKTDD